MKRYYCDGCNVEVPEAEIWDDDGQIADETVWVGPKKCNVAVSIHLPGHLQLCGRCVRQAIEKVLDQRYGKLPAAPERALGPAGDPIDPSYGGSR